MVEKTTDTNVEDFKTNPCQWLEDWWHTKSGGGRKIPLTNGDFTGFVFKSLNLDTADFYGSDLTGAKFFRCTLNRTEFCGVTFGRGFSFSAPGHSVQLEGAAFRKAKFELGTDFRGANLKSADFTSAELSFCDFSGTDLRFAKLRGCDAHRTCFDGADLRRAELCNTSFTEASFVGANLEGASLNNSSFKGADFLDSNMSGVSLYQTNFWGMKNLDPEVAFRALRELKASWR